MARHRYQTELRWQRNAADDLDYSRDHELHLPPTSMVLHISSDKAFKGDPLKPNPEQLLVAAASSCQFLSFIYVAHLANVTVTRYRDTATGVLDLIAKPARIVSITLRPEVAFAEEPPDDVLPALCEEAHRLCYIGNSLNVEIYVEPRICPPGPDAD